MSNLAFLATALPDSWDEVTIADVSSKVGSGSTPRGGSAVYVESGAAFIRSQNVYDHEFRSDGIVRLTEAAAEQLRGVTVEPNDVLINITGDSILRTCIAPTEILPARVSQHVAIVRSNTQIVPGFLQKWLSLPTMKDYMLNHSSGGTRKAITKGHLLSFPVPLPPLREQLGIAETLESLDAKIESNRAVTRLVPGLIRAKVDAKLCKGSESAPVARLADFVNGGAYTKGATGKGRMVIRIADLNSGPGSSTVYNDIQVPDNKTARAGDILMSWSGSLGVYRWFRDEAIINQHIFKVLPKSFPDWLVFDRLDYVLDVFQGIAKDKATTMGHIQRGHLESTYVELPDSPSIQSLDHELAPLWARLLLAEQESLQLERLRNALLPELLAGRIRVPESVEAVV